MSLSMDKTAILPAIPAFPVTRDATPLATAAVPVTAHTLKVANVAVSYHGHCVIRDVTLPIRSGHVTALLGPSGCGKSSLLNCFNRITDLLPGCSTQGNIFYNNEDILCPRYDVRGLRKNVGMIFQKPNPFPFSIAKNIELPLKENGIRDRHERQHIMESVLKSVGLWPEVCDRLHTAAHLLSGGQQQRLCIARALALSPEVLLMDEPCSALDPLASRKIEDLILQLRGEYTVIIVTHNLFQAQRIADDAGLFWLENGTGRLIEFGTRNRLFTEPSHALTRAYVSGQYG